MFTIKFHASRRLELDELLAGREKINNRLQDILDRHTDPWGIKVANRDLLGKFLHHELSDSP